MYAGGDVAGAVGAVVAVGAVPNASPSGSTTSNALSWRPVRLSPTTRYPSAPSVRAIAEPIAPVPITTAS